MGKRKQRGAALLVAAVVLIIVITTLVVTMSYLTGGATRAGAGNMQSAQALYLAEAGMERAIYRLHFIRTTAPLCDAALDETQSLGAGSYTTTFVRSAPANTTLSDPANLTAADTVIRVASVVGYPSQGRVRITTGAAFEDVNYSGVGTTAAVCGGAFTACFTGARRGAAGTTAIAHNNGDAVAPLPAAQCVITSTGTVGQASG